MISGKHYWGDGTPIAGQQHEYDYDDIGNRTNTKSGGDAQGAGLRSADYAANGLNQYTSRDVPGAVDVMGIAKPTATVTVNGQSAYRKGEYYWKELALDNDSAALWASVTNQAVLSGATNTTTRRVFLPQDEEAFGYDADGNMTNDGRWVFTWDAENRLVSLVALSGVPASAKKKLTFVYDVQGRRVSKKVYDWNTNTLSYDLSGERKFVYDGWNMIAELDGQSNTIRSYLWGTDLSGSLQGAGGVGGLLMIDDEANGAHLVAYDGNGNVRALVDASDGTVSAKYDYDPFGQTLRATGNMATDNPWRFSTKYQDDESDLYNYGRRYYTAPSGSWPNRDPLYTNDKWQTDSFEGNLYAFKSAINAVDYLGLADLVLGIAFDTSTGPNDADAKAFRLSYIRALESSLEQCCKKSPCECPKKDSSWCNIKAKEALYTARQFTAPKVNYEFDRDRQAVVDFINSIDLNPKPHVIVLYTELTMQRQLTDGSLKNIGGVGFSGIGAIIQLGALSKVLPHELGHVVDYMRPDNPTDSVHAPDEEKDNLMNSRIGSTPDCQWCEKIVNLINK